MKYAFLASLVSIVISVILFLIIGSLINLSDDIQLILAVAIVVSLQLSFLTGLHFKPKNDKQ
ncbi:hypothetical protein [Paenibacillus sp. KS-LC4]|uniref:hypothetical protein n=1 Tax=Paenibacillus sp. KS-LC4 TaxID=2979727 RepID=UPI0030D4A1E9